MITVRSFPQDTKVEVKFCRTPNGNGSHQLSYL